MKCILPHTPEWLGTPLCPGAVLDPTEDILYQWRLKRRLELARREAAMVSTESKQFHTATSSSLTVPPHSHHLCDTLPCTRRESQYQSDSYRNNNGPSGSCLCAGASSRSAHQTRDHPLQTCHVSLLEPASHSCDCVRAYDKTQAEDKVLTVSNPVSPLRPVCGESSPSHYRAGKQIEEELLNQSSIKQLSNDGHIGPDQAKLTHNTQLEAQAPKTISIGPLDPPSPTCHQEEKEDDDISLSNFSLNFTTEIDQTPQTNNEGLGTRTEGSLEPVVSQVHINQVRRLPNLISTKLNFSYSIDCGYM